MYFTLSDLEVTVTFLTQTKFPLLFTSFREPLRVYLCGISSEMPQECVSEASLAAALLFMSVKKAGGGAAVC